MPTKKIVIVGDDSVGKTSMALSFQNPEYRLEATPPSRNSDFIDNTIEIGGKQISLHVFDTDRQINSEIVYRKTHVFLACYACEPPASLANLRTVWIPKIRKFCPSARIILVGTKKDLRSSTGNDPIVHTLVSIDDVQALATEFNCNSFMKCSAFLSKDVSIRQLFYNAAQASIH